MKFEKIKAYIASQSAIQRFQKTEMQFEEHLYKKLERKLLNNLQKDQNSRLNFSRYQTNDKTENFFDYQIKINYRVPLALYFKNVDTQLYLTNAYKKLKNEYKDVVQFKTQKLEENFMYTMYTTPKKNMFTKFFTEFEFQVTPENAKALKTMVQAMHDKKELRKAGKETLQKSASKAMVL